MIPHPPATHRRALWVLLLGTAFLMHGVIVPRAFAKDDVAADGVAPNDAAARAHPKERLVADASDTNAPSKSYASDVAPHAWSEKDIALFSRIPIQEGGRVKPMATFARFTLMTMSGRSTVRYEVKGEKIKRGYVEWMLDALFTPDVAKEQPLFLVEDDQVFADIGLKLAVHKKRDRYTYNELKPARSMLMQKAMDYRKARQQEKTLTRLQQQVLGLANSVDKLEQIELTTSAARTGVTLDPKNAVVPEWKGKERATLTELLPHLGTIWQRARAGAAASSTPRADDPSVRVLTEISKAVRGASALTIVPPPTHRDDVDHWLSLRDATLLAVPQESLANVSSGEALKDALGVVAAWDGMGRSVGEPEVFTKHVSDALDRSVRLATTREEYKHVELEARYYEFDPLFKSHILYILAFLFLALTWFAPRMKWLFRIAVACTSAALLLHIVGIVVRSMIRGRPPVSTLYETVLFVSAGAVLTLLVVEFINRKRIAVVLATILGAAGLWLASGYEELVKQDTMPQLVAVLNTNFWLAVHVTTVTFGYSAGLMAACLGHVYVIGRIVGFKREQPAFYRDLTRMTYGLICFGLLFSIFGTMTGGIWANDSWGRFWGWDPKENGALMICLIELAILHGRMGGFIKQFGIAMSSIVLGVVVAFSWWHVNQLSYGLHSYGRTEGIMSALRTFYIVEAALLAGGVAWWVQQRVAKPA